ncbi:3-oxoadipate enol-lactonase [Corynebacterium halotolerans]|uniref:3-oxoadipate enol-lactonase n=1 Tax=Corynebacterium halotolerans TaxID=225326 RepID=UPI003CF17BBF
MTVLHHVSYGSNRDSTVVLLGSIGSNTDMWLPQLDALSHEHRVIALDHRGHGRSPVIPGSASVADLAADVLKTLDTLGVEKFKIAGVSLGGAVAQYLAATSDRVESAAFLCTSPKFGEPGPWRERAAAARTAGMASIADGSIPKWFSPDFITEKPATSDHYRTMIARTDSEGYASCCDALAGWDFTDRLGEIAVPVLTIAGDADPSTPPEVLQSIADKVQDGRAEVLSPGAHVPTVERPEAVNKLLQAHFAN